MGDYFGKGYQGPANIPHSDPDLFGMLFLGTHLGLWMAVAPGRLFGMEGRPRAWNRELVLSACNESAQYRELKRGKVPQQWYKGRPRYTDQSWLRMWDSHLHWKSWTQERMGPNHKAV